MALIKPIATCRPSISSTLNLACTAHSSGVEVRLSTERYREIDLFRAIAILMVVGFHYFSRWTEPRFDHNLYPIGDRFAEWVIFSHGHLGVDLFFMISGFVIAMTLESCRSFGDFFVRRAARLLPAMIVCSLLTMLVARTILGVPEFRQVAVWWNLLPSWTFTQPHLWAKFLPVTDHIDGAYWSLVVELKFYVWAALIYFWRRDNFTQNLTIFCLVIFIANLLAERYQIGILRSVESHVVFGRTAMLFAAGSLFYRLHQAQSVPSRYVVPLLACLALEVARTIIEPHEYDLVAVMIAFKIGFFAAFYLVSTGTRMPDNAAARPLIAIGLVSYPLYLLHQNIGVGLLSMAIEHRGEVIALEYVITIASIVAASFAIHLWIERPGKRLILSLWGHAKS